jgi:competence protein ComEC
LKLVYGNFSVLLTGDAGLASETRWLQQGLPLAATVLKVGHHGSDQSTSPALVAAVQPQIAVIQVGADNRYGHPAPAVLEALRGRHVLRTDEDGAAEILSDGTQMWIRSQAAVYYEMGLLQQN